MYQLFSQSLLKWKIQVTSTYNMRANVREMPKDILGTLKIFGIIHSMNFFHHPKFKTKIKTHHCMQRISLHPQVRAIPHQLDQIGKDILSLWIQGSEELCLLVLPEERD